MILYNYKNGENNGVYCIINKVFIVGYSLFNFEFFYEIKFIVFLLTAQYFDIVFFKCLIISNTMIKKTRRWFLIFYWTCMFLYSSLIFLPVCPTYISSQSLQDNSYLIEVFLEWLKMGTCLFLFVKMMFIFN